MRCCYEKTVHSLTFDRAHEWVERSGARWTVEGANSACVGLHNHSHVRVTFSSGQSDVGYTLLDAVENLRMRGLVE